MMNKCLLAAVVILALLGGSALAADTTAPAGTVTVGQFATRLVAALGQDATNLGAVRDSLRALGHAADFDASAPLTAGAAFRIASDLGVSVTPPANPAEVIGGTRATALAGYLAAVVVDRGPVTTSDTPTQCLSSVNRGACVNCCKDATGASGQFCGRFCHANVPPPPSPDEPQP